MAFRTHWGEIITDHTKTDSSSRSIQPRRRPSARPLAAEHSSLTAKLYSGSSLWWRWSAAGGGDAGIWTETMYGRHKSPPSNNGGGEPRMRRRQRKKLRPIKHAGGAVSHGPFVWRRSTNSATAGVPLCNIRSPRLKSHTGRTIVHQQSLRGHLLRQNNSTTNVIRVTVNSPVEGLNQSQRALKFLEIGQPGKH